MSTSIIFIYSYHVTQDVFEASSSLSFQEFDPAACRINLKGEFYYHPKLKEARNEVMTEASAPMKITADQAC